MATKQHNNQLRVLCVEDDPDIRAVLDIALREVGGFTTEVCESGAEALGKASSFQPDLILLDVMMPGMDGLTTMRKLRNLGGLATVPVVFLTTRLQQSDIDQYLALGARGVIPKPFDPMTLADQIAYFSALP